jgi:hypothetical protein
MTVLTAQREFIKEVSPANRLWKGAPESVEAFTLFILAQARNAGVTVKIGPDTGLAYPNAQALTCSGYFFADPLNRKNPELGVAMGGPWEDAFPVFIHEFAHLTQWRDQCVAWTDIFDANGVEAADRMDGWLSGEAWTPHQVKETFRAARAVEMDAEKRVCAMIKKHELPLDLDEYAKRANAYVLYYHHVEATRHWREADTLPPYRHPDVWPQATAVLGNPEVLPPALADAFAKAYGAWPEMALKNAAITTRRRPSP